MLTACNRALVSAGIVDYKLMDALPVECYAAKEGVRTFSIILVGEVVIFIIQPGNIDSLLMKNIDTLTQSERLMDSFTRRMAWY